MKRLVLESDRESLLAFVRSSVRDFAVEHPEVIVACVGLWGAPEYGSLDVSFDTPENSDDYFARFPDSAQDEHGGFCDNVSDFRFMSFRELSPASWRAALEQSKPGFEIEYPKGRIRTLSERAGDIEFSEPFFPFLLDLMRSLDDEVPTWPIRMRDPFRLAVQIYDIDAHFWVPGAHRTTQASGYLFSAFGGSASGLS